ncbi:hypothetical protein PVIIG_05625 [Plasmodium vivax India VII]|uniref:Uncharacterized protein n=1 Tax=Plasmodium vivax India VII TaxID=1077284 RepID=A0A0J9UVC6_PLAVI|nr:hypothetical protein PVIIG_05625 [Plasmodium vivax India VII]
MKRLEFNKSFGQFLKLASIELPSKNFYNYLKSSNEGLNQHYEECKSLYSLPNTDSKIIKICEKLVNYLKTNYEEEENNGDLKDHHCNLLSFWIYEQLNKKIKGTLPPIIPIYGGYQLILSDVLKDPKESQAIDCLRNVSVFAFDNWKDRKDLYDYCVDYDDIIKIAASSYEKCKEYEEYIKGKSRLYKQFDSLYTSTYNKENTKFYEKCKSYNPESVLPTLKCEQKFPEQAKAKGFSQDPVLLDSTPISVKKPDSTDTYGNVLLGVVVTSMTSGMLYKEDDFATVWDGIIIVQVT